MLPRSQHSFPLLHLGLLLSRVSRFRYPSYSFARPSRPCRPRSRFPAALPRRFLALFGLRPLRLVCIARRLASAVRACRFALLIALALGTPYPLVLSSVAAFSRSFPLTPALSRPASRRPSFAPLSVLLQSLRAPVFPPVSSPFILPPAFRFRPAFSGLVFPLFGLVVVLPAALVLPLLLPACRAPFLLPVPLCGACCSPHRCCCTRASPFCFHALWSPIRPLIVFRFWCLGSVVGPSAPGCRLFPLLLWPLSMLLPLCPVCACACSSICPAAQIFTALCFFFLIRVLPVRGYPAPLSLARRPCLRSPCPHLFGSSLPPPAALRAPLPPTAALASLISAFFPCWTFPPFFPHCASSVLSLCTPYGPRLPELFLLGGHSSSVAFSLRSCSSLPGFGCCTCLRRAGPCLLPGLVFFSLLAPSLPYSPGTGHALTRGLFAPLCRVACMWGAGACSFALVLVATRASVLGVSLLKFHRRSRGVFCRVCPDGGEVVSGCQRPLLCYRDPLSSPFRPGAPGRGLASRPLAPPSVFRFPVPRRPFHSAVPLLRPAALVPAFVVLALFRPFFVVPGFGRPLRLRVLVYSGGACLLCSFLSRVGGAFALPPPGLLRLCVGPPAGSCPAGCFSAGPLPLAGVLSFSFCACGCGVCRRLLAVWGCVFVAVWEWGALPRLVCATSGMSLLSCFGSPRSLLAFFPPAAARGALLLLPRGRV